MVVEDSKEEQSKTILQHNNVLRYVFKPPSLYVSLKTQQVSYIKYTNCNYYC